jgi:hypothetical protein
LPLQLSRLPCTNRMQLVIYEMRQYKYTRNMYICADANSVSRTQKISCAGPVLVEISVSKNGPSCRRRILNSSEFGCFRPHSDVFG